MRTKQDRMSAILGNLSQLVKKASGWQRVVIALSVGALSALALPPFHLWPVLFVTFPVVVWLLDGIPTARSFGSFGLRAAAWTGWWFGFGYFLAGLYWFGYAYHFAVDMAVLDWLLPVAVMVVPAVLAVFTALGLALARLVWPERPVRILSLAASLTAAEWLRGHVFSGFPWNAFGYALSESLVLAQSAAWVGIWGLTFFAVVIFAGPATLADDPVTTRRRWLPSACSVVLLAVFAAGGALRLSQHPVEEVAGVRLRLVQPNLPNGEQAPNAAALQGRLASYRALSNVATETRPQGLSEVTHLIWPEDALPFYVFPPQIMNFMPTGAALITGSLRLTNDAHGPRTYNSAFVVNRDGAIISYYDKVHLVPFGEYLPLRALLQQSDLVRFTKVSQDVSAGRERRALKAPGAPDFLPLIGYEAIFPDDAAPSGTRPGWIVNLTNDGWFGNGSGPDQHFQQARLRAIEQGLPLVRAANNGISAIVDPLGRIVAALPFNSQGVIDGILPRALPTTFYATYGDYGVAGLIGLALFALCFHYLRQRS
jgi:apolipoprotein N-acyltransferase